MVNSIAALPYVSAVNAHLYHDKVDDRNYILDAGYTMNGIGYWLQRELSWAYAPSERESV